MAKRATNADGNDATQPGKLKRKSLVSRICG